MPDPARIGACQSGRESNQVCALSLTVTSDNILLIITLQDYKSAILFAAFGEMAEWSNAPVLKTGMGL